MFGMEEGMDFVVGEEEVYGMDRVKGMYAVATRMELEE